MPSLHHFAVLVTTSLVLLLPPSSLGQDFADAADKVDNLEAGPDGDSANGGFGLSHLGSPEAKAQNRRTEDLEPTAYDPYAPQESPWFLRDESTRRELGIEEQDVEPLYDDYQAVWQRHQQRQAKLEAGRTEQEQAIEDRAELERELRAEFNRDLEALAARRFSDAQRQRYQELNYQYRGVNAFADPTYVDQFNFDNRQLATIDGLRRDYNRRLGQIRNSDASLQDRRTAYRDLQQQTAADLDRTLSDRQRQTMQRLNGRPYQFNDRNFVGSAPDLDAGNARGRQRTGTPGTANPGSGVGLPQGGAAGSGIGSPQPSGTGSTSGSPSSGGPGGTASDLDN